MIETTDRFDDPFELLYNALIEAERQTTHAAPHHQLTARQAYIIVYRLQGHTYITIANKIGINLSNLLVTINRLPSI